MSNRKDQVESWFRNYGKNVQKWTKARSLQDAEDILQETAISLLTNPGDWNDISLKRVHKFANYDYYSRNKNVAETSAKFVALDDIMNMASSSNLTEELITKKSVELIAKILETVSDKKASYTGFNTGNTLLKIHRDIFMMRFFEEMDYDEIADKLNITHGSARQLGSKAAKLVTGKFKEVVK